MLALPEVSKADGQEPVLQPRARVSQCDFTCLVLELGPGFRLCPVAIDLPDVYDSKRHSAVAFRVARRVVENSHFDALREARLELSAEVICPVRSQQAILDLRYDAGGRRALPGGGLVGAGSEENRTCGGQRRASSRPLLAQAHHRRLDGLVANARSEGCGRIQNRRNRCFQQRALSHSYAAPSETRGPNLGGLFTIELCHAAQSRERGGHRITRARVVRRRLPGPGDDQVARVAKGPYPW